MDPEQIERLASLHEQGFGRGDLPNLDEWANLTNEEKMFMAFQH